MNSVAQNINNESAQQSARKIIAKVEDDQAKRFNRTQKDEDLINFCDYNS